MDLEILEALALSEDRTAALGHLLPGSEDHDYYRCLHAQHRGAIDEADAVLEAWVGRHGATERYTRLKLRHTWCKLGVDEASVADEIRDHFGVSHWHEAEVAEVDPTRATKLAPGTFDGATLLGQAVEYGTDLSQVTDEGIYELLDHEGLRRDEARRRALLQRLSHTPHPELVRLINEDLSTKGSGGFGSLRIHNELTLDQLHALAGRRPDVRTDRAWIEAVVRRMRPPIGVDLELDRDAREAYLVEMWKFVAGLPPASNSLKAHVLWHLLDALRRRDVTPDATLIAAYLQLPRSAGYLPHRWLERIRSDEMAQLGADFRQITDLSPAGDDEELVRDLLHRRIGEAEQFAQWLERSWLDAEIASAHLLYGTGDSDRATLVLGPARAAALRDRIDLTWCLHNPTRFGTDAPIVIEADVKHVPDLVVKVFRIDPLAYFQHNRREVNTDLDLDGLAASHELVMRFSEPAIRRVRRRIELPMCTRAGTYVIDLIGNGMSSRAVVHKGRLRHVARLGAAGHVVTILDETDAPRTENGASQRTLASGTDAHAWIGDREYRLDDKGSFVVPFSTTPGPTPMLMSCGDIATVNMLDLARENYALSLDLMLDRQALITGGTARAVARVRLTVAGAPASLAVLEQPTWNITLTDRHGVATTKEQPLVLDDTEAALLELPLGEAAATISIAVHGRVRVVSEQRDQDLVQSQHIEIAQMHGSLETEALYLAYTPSGWVISALGKSGEPRAQRPLTVSLVHRWARTQLNVELATDAQGRCELGELPGIERISTTLGGSTLTWIVGDPAQGFSVVRTAPARDIVLPLPPSRTADELLRHASLIELRGPTPARHPAATAGSARTTAGSARTTAGSARTTAGSARTTIEALAGALVIRGLAPGDYALRTAAFTVGIRVATPGPEILGSIVTAGEVIELTKPVPAIAELTLRDGLRVRVVEPSQRTRVHVIATRFFASLLPRGTTALRGPAVRLDRARGVAYVSGRELGDEYRYVLERRNAKRFPTLLLDKPTLLLNPWARRTTTTDVAVARAGGAFAPSPAPMQAAGYGGTRGGRDEAMAEDSYVAYDFLSEPPVVLANLVPDRDGMVNVPLAELGRATCVTIIVDDPAGTTSRRIALPETTLQPRDLRLQLALDPTRHASQRKAIASLRPGESLVIADLATAKVHLIDSVERAHAYLLALRDDATLREFSFITRWHLLAEPERRELYSKYACHELHLFLYGKDRAFFDAVVRPYLAHKRTKTFLDHWLLDADMTPYLEPALLARLNAVERALLARRLTAEPAIARLLADEVTILPPDPDLDTRIIDTLIGASTLDGNEDMKGFADKALADRLTASVFEPADEQEMDMPMAETAAAPQAPRPKPARRAEAKKKMSKSDSMDYDEESGNIAQDVERRRDAAPMYRAVDRTQEWAEHNWWHLTPAQSGADLISPSKLWRDLALHTTGAFLSPWLGLATTTFAEAMCALAVTDLPFIAGAHAITADGPRLTIAAAGNALVGSSQLVEGALVEGGSPLVVGQTYVRTDDRHRWVDGEQIDKYIEGAFIASVVYTCQVVLANPTSTRQRIAALVQIPRGSIALGGARQTHTIDIVLEPYGTHGHEYAFYFPTPGRYTHFPVHVSRGGTIVAAAPSRTLEVTAGGDAVDPHSWPHISQRGSLADVVSFLESANFAEISLEDIAWRLRDRAAYDALLGVLERRRAFDQTLWGYALLHHDRPRTRVWARSLDQRLLEAGPVLDMPMIDLDAEALGGYEHLELAPLINARAHRLGAKQRILNDGLAAQYQRFLDLVAHRRTPTSEDLLAAAAYLLAQDRYEASLTMLARVRFDAITDRLQHDYLAAYAACLIGDLPRARQLAATWRELPVDRWRRKFEALANMLGEVEGGAPVVVDPKSREQQHAELAAKQPAFELTVDRDGIIIRQQHVTALELRFFEMDVELLFSRQPFVQSDVSRFSFIEPGHREQLTNLPPEHRLAWPAALRGKNVVVEVVGAGSRKAKIHYANDLATNLSHQYGQVRVQRASDKAALAATYVKVYAKKRGGAVAFYKDGYTDLRGWFDYATLSTDDLDHVERFAILVSSDQSGSAILEASPPAR